MSEVVPYASALASVDGGEAGLALSEHTRLDRLGVTISPGATSEEIAGLLAGFDVMQDTSCFAIGDIALHYRRELPDEYKRWWEGLPKQDPNKGTLDQKTVRVYSLVCAAFSHEVREPYRTEVGSVGEGRRVLSFAHFSRVYRYVKDGDLSVAQAYLETAAAGDLSYPEFVEMIEGGAAPGADEVPVLPEVPVSVFGEAYWLGPPEDPQRHLLVCGDSTRPEHLAYFQHMGALGAMIWTDPPYGVDIGEKNAWLNANEIGSGSRLESDLAGDTVEDVRALLNGAWAAAAPWLEESAPFYVAGPSGKQAADFLASFDAAGWRFRQMLIWKKNIMVIGRSDYHGKHETIFYGYVGGGRVGRMSSGDGAPRWYGDNSQTTVFEVDRPRASKEHPTMKPVELILPAIKNSSRPGEVVYEPFAGSGSTLIAADQTGRRCFAIEYDPAYADVIRLRYANWLASEGTRAVVAEQKAKLEREAAPAYGPGAFEE